MQVIDLSWKYTNDIRVFDGGIQPVIRKIGNTNAGDGLELTYIDNFCMHYGTHLDCPGHFIAGGFHVDDKPAGFFLGEGIVIDCSGYQEGMHYGMEVLNGVDLSNKQFVFFHINWAKNWDKPEQYGPYPVMTSELAQHLAGLDGIQGIGVETNNVDTTGDAEFPIHKAFLSCNNKVLYEAVTNLDLLIGMEFQFMGLPLNVDAGEGAPVRAIAILK